MNFDYCFPRSGLDELDPYLISLLNDLEQYLNKELQINSAYRSEQWELDHGRKGTSSHCKGKAVDIACKDVVSRLHLLFALVHLGFRRIGIAKSFIHVDIDIAKPECIWLY